MRVCVRPPAKCELICPEVFEVELVAVVRDEHPGPSLHERVREAADACPTGAILLDPG